MLDTKTVCRHPLHLLREEAFADSAKMVHIFPAAQMEVAEEQQGSLPHQSTWDLLQFASETTYQKVVEGLQVDFLCYPDK